MYLVDSNHSWIKCACPQLLTLQGQIKLRVLDILGCLLVLGPLHASHCSAKA